MDDRLRDFLEERAIAAEDIERMSTNKLDYTVIILMDDDQLEEYIPLYGDRLAIKDFCRRQRGTTDRHNKDKRKGLLASIKTRILKKMSVRNSTRSREDSNYENKIRGVGNISAFKTTRSVQLSWVHSDENKKYKQVRAKTGGGIRQKDISKVATMKDVQDIAMAFFFPGGNSVRGHVTDFTIEFLDFKYQPVPSLTTVEDMYDRDKLRLLRFHMHTKYKNTTVTDVETPSITPIPSSSRIVSHEIVETTSAHEVLDIPFENEEIVENTFVCDAGENISHSWHTENIESILSADSEILFDPLNASSEYLDSTLPYSAIEPLHQESDETDIPNHFKLRIHRGHCLMEMIQQFTNPDICSAISFDVTMVFPNGEEERGSGDGVFRDCITEFWAEFAEQCCNGNQEKIPVIRHDFQSTEWTSVARIILKGYTLLKYFPAFLSMSVVEVAFYGEQKSNLLDSFLNCITESEKSLFNMALLEFENVYKEELLDVLDNHNCRSKVTKDTLKPILLEVAHKDLIQEPKYIVECWAKVLKPLGAKIASEQLRELYEYSIPTPRKIIQLLRFPEQMSSLESEVASHLKRFIHELEEQTLKNFLRFSTGSNLMIPGIDKITVAFVTLEGLLRRPIARTCGKVLELPRFYESYTVFRNELKSILSSDIWIMDIV